MVVRHQRRSRATEIDLAACLFLLLGVPRPAFEKVVKSTYLVNARSSFTPRSAVDLGRVGHQLGIGGAGQLRDNSARVALLKRPVHVLAGKAVLFKKFAIPSD